VAELIISGTTLGTSLSELLNADEIVPGTEPSYQICKAIYAYHPLGAKMAESPVRMAQSQRRELVIQKGPEERVREAFEAEWEALGADRHIFNVMRTARIYGVGSLAMLTEGVPADRPINFEQLADAKISFNVFDPLNTSGSLVLNQDPNAMNFQKSASIAVQGTNYHRSRSCVILNEDPLYIQYTNSAFGYVGRSVYQRALYPLKSFLQSMITDDMVTLKSGVLVAKMKQAGSIVDRVMASAAGIKRELLKEAQNKNVISISPEEDIESLNLQNIDGANMMARKNILENIAVSADMPAKLLNSETFVEGFGEGTEDAKQVARYIDRVRIEMAPLYEFFDKIVQWRAWNAEWYKTIQADFPEYKNVPYKQAFYDFVNSFRASWPNLLTEPDSEKIKVEDVKFRAVISLVEALLPKADPENTALIFQWAADNFNEQSLLFTSPLNLDYEALANYEPPQQAGAEEPQPNDKLHAAVDSFGTAIARLPQRNVIKTRAAIGAR
jgi:hypothetical protein